MITKIIPKNVKPLKMNMQIGNVKSWTRLSKNLNNKNEIVHKTAVQIEIPKLRIWKF
jgi:hypothetical protein